MYIAIDTSYHAADEKKRKKIFLLKRGMTVHTCTCDSHHSYSKLPFQRENRDFLTGERS